MVVWPAKDSAWHISMFWLICLKFQGPTCWRVINNSTMVLFYLIILFCYYMYEWPGNADGKSGVLKALNEWEVRGSTLASCILFFQFVIADPVDYTPRRASCVTFLSPLDPSNTKSVAQKCSPMVDLPIITTLDPMWAWATRSGLWHNSTTSPPVWVSHPPFQAHFSFFLFILFSFILLCLFILSYQKINITKNRI